MTVLAELVSYKIDFIIIVKYNYIMKYYAQIGQDKLVDFIFKNKENGFFIDIGAQDPEDLNNTSFFEKYRNWNGVAIEKASMWNDKWANSSRKKTLYINNDARSIDYKSILRDNSLDVVDYISLDLEPPQVTFDVLKNIITQNIKFKVMTFEVDAYRSEDVKNRSRELLSSNGYELKYELYFTDNTLKNAHVDDVWINKDYIKDFNFLNISCNKLEFNFILNEFTNIPRINNFTNFCVTGEVRPNPPLYKR